MCRKERLRAVEFDRTAILFFERASDCTNCLHVGELSHVFLYTAILGLFRSYWTSSRSSLAYIGFTAVKNTDCLSFLRLPLGIGPLLITECISSAFLMWQMHSAKSSGNRTLSCNVGSKRLPPECPWIALKYRKCLEELGFKQYRNLFFGPRPLQNELSKLCIAKYHSNFALNFPAKSSNLTAP